MACGKKENMFTRIKAAFSNAGKTGDVAAVPAGDLGQATDFKRQGDGLLGRGQWAEAALYYGRALAIDPAYAEACVNLGYALKELGEHEQAQRQLQHAIAIDAGAAVAVDAFYILGTICREQGRQPEAIVNWSQAIRLKPDFQVG